jgi:hypothetical protein
MEGNGRRGVPGRTEFGSVMCVATNYPSNQVSIASGVVKQGNKWQELERLPIHKAHMLKQKVTLCGHDSLCFRDLYSTFAHIHRFVDENFAVGDIWPLGPSSFVDMDSIMAETRVLTPQENNTWNAKPEGLTPLIDPDSVLRSVVHNGKYLFTKDNVVQYLQMIPDETEG